MKNCCLVSTRDLTYRHPNEVVAVKRKNADILPQAADTFNEGISKLCANLATVALDSTRRGWAEPWALERKTKVNFWKAKFSFGNIQSSHFFSTYPEYHTFSHVRMLSEEILRNLKHWLRLDANMTETSYARSKHLMFQALARELWCILMHTGGCSERCCFT